MVGGYPTDGQQGLPPVTTGIWQGDGARARMLSELWFRLALVLLG